MRKIVAGIMTSLDGVTDSPEQWMGPYFAPEIGQVVGSIMGAQDSILLGRVTYETLAAHYPPVLAYLAETANEPLPLSIR